MRFGLDVAQQRMPWDELVRRVQLAEELGFDGAWGFDHYQPMYGEGPGETFELELSLVRASRDERLEGLLVWAIHAKGEPIDTVLASAAGEGGRLP